MPKGGGLDNFGQIPSRVNTIVHSSNKRRNMNNDVATKGITVSNNPSFYLEILFFAANGAKNAE